MIVSSVVPILYVLDHWAGARGGTERQLLYLVRNLDRRRFAPRLAVFRTTPPLSEDAFGCPVDVLGIARLRSLRALRQLAGLTTTVRGGRIGVVHVLFNDASVAAPFPCKLGGAKVVVSRRDLGFWYTPGRLASLRFSNLFVDRVVANSRAVARNVCAREAIPENRIRIVYNGYQEEVAGIEPSPGVRVRLGIGEQDPVIGMVANLSGLKRPGDLLSAFARVRNDFPTAHLVLAGDGDQRGPLLARVRALGLAGSVHLLGSIDGVIPVVRACDVCVLCSESEGLSNAVIEYLACGKPTVCTDVGGNPELVRDGENGYLVPVGDIGALADRIRRLLADRTLAATLGRRARESIGSRFSMDDMVRSYMEIYEELVAPDPRRSRPVESDRSRGAPRVTRVSTPGKLPTPGGLVERLASLARRGGQRLRRAAGTPLFVLIQAALARLPFRPLEVAWFYVLQLSLPCGLATHRRSKVAVRLATTLDLDALVACQDKRALFLERFLAGEYCFMATLGGKVVGYEWLCVADNHEEERYRYRLKIPPSAVYVYDAYITPEYRLRGVWVYLKLHIAEFVRQLGRQSIITMIDYGNGLSMRTHLRYGYSPVRRVLHVGVLGLRLFFEKERPAIPPGRRQDAERD